MSDFADYAGIAAPASAFHCLGDLDARIAAVEGHGMDLMPTVPSALIKWSRYHPTDASYGDLLAGLNALGASDHSFQPLLGPNVRVFRYRAGRTLSSPHGATRTGGVRRFLKRRQGLRHWAHTLAIKTIVQAVDRHTPKGHKVTLNDYSLLGVADFQSLPPPAPIVWPSVSGWITWYTVWNRQAQA
ncbi:hypothetical protein [Marinobacter alexandrii]|uniref:hypothetical protein n=1 Tax=Marinobacter alexandrii TaxID=2570351 RepID=UPI001108EE7C|nr:hypothetical protein [Marinobacter alexandrii]